jgi:hypothetical protein
MYVFICIIYRLKGASACHASVLIVLFLGRHIKCIPYIYLMIPCNIWEAIRFEPGSLDP